MDSRHLVDPELLPLLDAWPTVTLSTDSLEELRHRKSPFPPAEDHDVEWESHTIDGGIGVRVYRPLRAVEPLGCIFHIHGGGFVGGSVAEVEFLHRPLVAELQCALVSVDYRLAPETKYPGNIEDCYAALAWTFDRLTGLGVDRARIGVMGESAGGGLAAALALAARARGDFQLCFQHLIYPMLDDRTCVRAPHPFAGEFVWHPTNSRFGWTALLGEPPGGETVSQFAAPARAVDVSGLPPTFIATGALDLFVDENIDYAQRLIRAGVPTELHVWPGAFHGFDVIPGPVVADAARRTSCHALRRFLTAAE